MQGVQQQLDSPERDEMQRGPGGKDPAYQLLLQCLELVVSIDNEIANLHNYMKDKYKTKFPELASFVQDAVQYAQTIQLIANEMDLTKVTLDDVLPQVFTYSFFWPLSKGTSEAAC